MQAASVPTRGVLQDIKVEGVAHAQALQRVLPLLQHQLQRMQWLLQVHLAHSLPLFGDDTRSARIRMVVKKGA